MIQLNKKNYPYPVLAPGRDDYNECFFEVFFSHENISVTEENIEIPISYKLKCNSLENMILDNKAQVIIKIKSSPASYSRIVGFAVDEKEQVLKIPKYDVISNIELTGLIVAKEKIENYTCSELNQLYFSGMKFNLQKGDFLALDITRKIYIDDSELEKPLASIFTINKVQEQEEGVVVDFWDQKINVNLSVELNKMYWTLKDFNNGALRRYVIGIIVFPALVEAIEQIKDHYKEAADEDYSENRWFRAIELKAKKYDVIMSEYYGSSVALANKLLGDIALDALKSFKEMLDQEMNDGETHMIGGVD